MFEYYCSFSNRSRLNFTELNATNWAKLCRDCHLVLDPRGVTLNKEDSLSAMEASGCWVTPGEVDVVFVRSATADTHISGLDHGVLSFDTFQLALARLVRIVDARAGPNLRSYRHEFASFKDGHANDYAYAHPGNVDSDDEDKVWAAKDDDVNTSLTKAQMHTSLSVRALLLSEGATDSKEGEGRLVKKKPDPRDPTSPSRAELQHASKSGPKALRGGHMPEALEPHPKEWDGKMHALSPAQVDEYLMKRSVAAVDSGGSMTFVHRYAQQASEMLELSEALALVVSRCILPHASRLTCDGYGKKEALATQKLLQTTVLQDVVLEEHQFTERVFVFYAEARDDQLPGWVPAKERMAAVTFREVQKFARDFGLSPALATRTELFMCFRACRRDPVQNPNLLSYPEFVEFLARLALMSFSKPYLAKHHRQPHHKVHGFFGWCRASDGLSKVETAEWSRGHSRAGLKMRKSFITGTNTRSTGALLKHGRDRVAKSDGVDDGGDGGDGDNGYPDESPEEKAQRETYERVDQTMAIIRGCSMQTVGRHLDLADLFSHIDADGSGSIDKDEFVRVLGAFVPEVAEQERGRDSRAHKHIITVEDVGKLFEFFDADGDGSVEYTEFAYQFYNRRQVSDRMKSKNTGGKYQRHGHIRGKVAEDTGELLFDLDFTDAMSGDKPLTRSEVARLRNRLRQYVSLLLPLCSCWASK